MEIGKRIAELRTQSGYTLKDLSIITGIAASHISDVENARSNISIEKLEKLCEAFNITLSDFFNDKDVKTNVGKEIVDAYYALKETTSPEELGSIPLLIKRLIDIGEISEDGDISKKGLEILQSFIKIENMLKKG